MAKRLQSGLIFLILSGGSVAPAMAGEIGAGFSVNGGATLVSDYRFRGISQSDKRFVIQGSATVSHKSGFYATVWGSSIDDYVASGADAELDLIAGYRKTFGGVVAIQVQCFRDRDLGIMFTLEEGNPNHCEVFGPRTSGKKKQLRGLTKWVRYPANYPEQFEAEPFQLPTP